MLKISGLFIMTLPRILMTLLIPTHEPPSGLQECHKKCPTARSPGAFVRMMPLDNVLQGLPVPSPQWVTFDGQDFWSSCSNASAELIRLQSLSAARI